jgi:hypothetical protein
MMRQLRQFSQAAKTREKHAIYLISEYGDMMNIRPHTRARTHKTKYTDMRDVKYITDQTEARTLLKQLNHSPTSHFMFNPEKCHYVNSRTIYQALKK